MGGHRTWVAATPTTTRGRVRAVQQEAASARAEVTGHPEFSRILGLQRLIGNTQVRQLLLARQAAPAIPDRLPAPVTVVWSTDPFVISFERIREGGGSRFSFAVRYTGRARTSGPFVQGNTARLGVLIGETPLNARVAGGDATSVSVDLYGDGQRVVKLVDRARLDSRPDSQGREHDLSTELDQVSRSGTSVWVLDPKASAGQITGRGPEEYPGENPVATLQGPAGHGYDSMLIDGDADQDKELELRLQTIATWPDAAAQDIVKTLQVTAIQRSTGAARSATFELQKPGLGGSLFPVIRDVTDGHAPTRIDLLWPFGTRFLEILPGVHTADVSRYTVRIDPQSTDLSFPLDPRPRRRVAVAGPATSTAGFVSVDVKLGAYSDPFRLTFRQMQGGATTFGISAVSGGELTGTAGAELQLSGPLRYSVVDTGATSVGIDLNGDAKADVELFDQLTTPTSVDGGGPPAQARNHRIRLIGPAVSGERTFDFTYRDGEMRGGFDHPAGADKEAERNAEAAAVLGSQLKGGGLADQLDQLEIQAFVVRRRAVDLGVMRQETFDAVQTLWQALVQARAEPTSTVRPATKSRALDAAAAYAREYGIELGPTSTFRQLIAPSLVSGAIASDSWSVVFDRYTEAMTQLDDVLHTRLVARQGDSGEQAAALGQLGAMRKELHDLPHEAIRVAASFHPDEKFATEQGYVSVVPLQLYAWRDGDEWRLRDVTNPNKHWDYDVTASGTGQALPPIELFGELDDIDHFPAGVINFAVPGGVAGRVTVRDHLTWKRALTYLGLGLAAVGITLATAGTGTVAVVGAYALAASAVTGAIAAGIDLAEHIKRDNLDASTAVLDIAQIVAGLAGGGSIVAGTIIKGAATAPAAARFAGAWARAASLAQKAYLPLAATTAGADVVTVAVLAHDTLHQLEEIERGPGDESSRTHAKWLLLSQLAALGGLAALSLKGTVADLRGGRSLVLTPGPEGIPVASLAVGADTIIIDSNVAIALEKRATNPASLQPGERALLARYDQMVASDVRIADRTAAEASQRTGQIAPQHGFGVGVDRASDEYKKLRKVLDDVNLGGGKGAADREIVADAFFAVGEPGATPTFASMDPGVYNKLYTIQQARDPALKPLNKLGKPLSQAEPFRNGFVVEINGRTLKVLPLPNK